MSDEIMADIQRSLGRIEGTLNSHVDAFNKHVEMDERAYKTIFELSKTQARQKGFISAIAALGSAIGAAAGVVAHKLLSSQ